MKKKLLCLLLLVAAFAQGQTLTIPDGAFNTLLLNSGTGNSIAIDSSGDAIAIDANGDGLIQEDEADEVRQLHVDVAAIASLAGIEGFANLRILTCTGNQLTTLDLTALSDLREVNCADNSIATLNVEGLDHLEMLNCSGNSITDLYLIGMEYLQTLSCADNNLTELDLSYCPVLTNLTCNDNQLTLINIKNGAEQSGGYIQNIWTGNPLQYICIDENEAAYVNDLLTLNGYTTGINVNSYCTFTPGGDYNTITGGLLFDNANNGCDASDPPHAFVKLKLNDGFADCYTFTDSAGQYAFYTGVGNSFTVTPHFENDSFYTASPASGTIGFIDMNNNIVTQDFCVTANGVQNDVEVVMVPITSAVPGQNATYKMVYKNKGNTTIPSGNISCVWDTNIIANLVGIYPWPNDMFVNYYGWDFYNLMPFETREITMTFTLDPSVVSVGDDVPFAAAANIGTATDAIGEDNNFTFTQKMEAAYQDNFILCVEGDTAPASAIGKYLHYQVNFTNTGTETINNVVITQQFDPLQFDISTLEILNSSHSMTARVSGNVAEFTMAGANVVDGNGHGGILIKIKTKPNLQQNSTVSGQAAMFFDFAAPVQTNSANTTFETLSTGNFEKDATVIVTPNPVISITKITAQSIIKQVIVYDVQGRQLEVQLVNDAAVSIDLTSRAAGMYFVKVVTENGVSIQKVMKQ
jgi:Secretion system C-terminal sorting domain